jgi:hypothetical protein
MRCESSDDYVTMDDCKHCEDNDSCEQYGCALANEDAIKGKNDAVRKSELATKMRTQLASLLNLDEATLDDVVNGVMSNVLTVLEKQYKTSMDAIIQAKITECIQARAEQYFNQEFEKALAEKIIAMQPNGKATTTKIQQIVLDRFNKFLSDKNNYRSQDLMVESIDKVISKHVAAKVEVALKELQSEAIDKFNKEAMKMMMAGMAKAISNDKRLLAVLTNE